MFEFSVGELPLSADDVIAGLLLLVPVDPVDHVPHLPTRHLNIIRELFIFKETVSRGGSGSCWSGEQL